MNITTLLLAILGAALLGTTAFPAAAQDHSTPPDKWPYLLRYAQVADELKLDKLQKEQLARVFSEAEDNRVAASELGPHTSEVLTLEQRRRLAEIRSQVQVTLGSLPPDYHETLRLTPAQNETLRKARADNARLLSVLQRRLMTERLTEEGLKAVRKGAFDQARENVLKALSAEERKVLIRRLGREFVPAVDIAQDF
jgi:hypothetical protein